MTIHVESKREKTPKSKLDKGTCISETVDWQPRSNSLVLIENAICLYSKEPKVKLKQYVIFTFESSCRENTIDLFKLQKVSLINSLYNEAISPTEQMILPLVGFNQTIW